jgi:hypothetical protein
MATQQRGQAFTLTIDKQDGRRFCSTFSSPRSSEKVIAVISRGGAIANRPQHLQHRKFCEPSGTDASCQFRTRAPQQRQR